MSDQEFERNAWRWHVTQTHPRSGADEKTSWARVVPRASGRSGPRGRRGVGTKGGGVCGARIPRCGCGCGHQFGDGLGRRGGGWPRRGGGRCIIQAQRDQNLGRISKGCAIAGLEDPRLALRVELDRERETPAKHGDASYACADIEASHAASLRNTLVELGLGGTFGRSFPAQRSFGRTHHEAEPER